MPCLAGDKGLPDMEGLVMNQFDAKTMNQVATWVFQCAGRFAEPNLDADDLAQITLEKILKTKSLPRVLNYRWIYVTTGNVKNDLLRSLFRERRFLDTRISIDSIKLGLASDDAVFTPMHQKEQNDPFLTESISDSINNLQPAKKEALLLYLDGHSYKEISALTDAPLNTIRTRIHYAKRDLQNAISA